MTESSPKQAIIEYVGSSFGVLQLSSRSLMNDQMQEAAEPTAKVVTVHFFQERSLPHRQVHKVAFENETGQQEHWLCFLMQDEQGRWHVQAAANIAEVKDSPIRNYPWANLAGGGKVDEFWAGGYVIDNGLGVERVRLIAENGSVLEDTPQEGLVLFVTNQKVRMPLQVELYDHSENLVGTHTFPWKLHPA